MKATGMTRQLDTLGRVVIPVEIRRTLGIETKDLLNISVEGDRIILSKHSHSCSICGAEKDLSAYQDRLFCRKCLTELSKL